MKKRFNVTGTCIPEKHYMVDISEKLKNIVKLVDNEEYFIINRPRQYGKTTTLIETKLDLGFYNQRAKFINEDKSLDIKKILIKFQEFMKHEYSEKRKTFLEDDGIFKSV